MKDHPSLQERIPEYVAGRLADDDRDRFELHLAGCLECEELVSCCEAIALRIRQSQEAPGEEHPDPATWVAYARGSLRDEALTRHLDLCPSCALEVKVWRGWRPDAPAPRPATPLVAPVPRLFRPAAWPSFLAGATAGAIACFAVLSWRTVSLVVPPPAPGAAGGPAPLLLLEDAVRNGGTASAVKIGSGQPFLPIGIRVSLPTGVADRDRFAFSVRGVSQPSSVAPSWTQELSAERIRAEQARAWVVGFLVPANGHPPGRYVLRVAPVDGSGKSLMEVPFEILP